MFCPGILYFLNWKKKKNAWDLRTPATESIFFVVVVVVQSRSMNLFIPKTIYPVIWRNNQKRVILISFFVFHSSLQIFVQRETYKTRCSMISYYKLGEKVEGLVFQVGKDD